MGTLHNLPHCWCRLITSTWISHQHTEMTSASVNNTALPQAHDKDSLRSESQQCLGSSDKNGRQKVIGHPP
eukprot:5071573-Amphidinium_carterae.1